jgi:hypothetical protein
MGKKRKACAILLGKSEGKSLLGKPEHRREEVTKMQEI